jgi:hypothetical protein
MQTYFDASESDNRSPKKLFLLRLIKRQSWEDRWPCALAASYGTFTLLDVDFVQLPLQAIQKHR